MAMVNTTVYREPNGTLSVNVGGQPMNGIAQVQIVGSNGAASIEILMPLANVQFSERPIADNVIPFPHS